MLYRFPTLCLLVLFPSVVCDGAGDLTVALWRFASLRLAPVSIRMCPLGFPHVAHQNPKGTLGIQFNPFIMLHHLRSFFCIFSPPCRLILRLRGGSLAMGGDWVGCLRGITKLAAVAASTATGRKIK